MIYIISMCIFVCVVIVLSAEKIGHQADKEAKLAYLTDTLYRIKDKLTHEQNIALFEINKEVTDALRVLKD